MTTSLRHSALTGRLIRSVGDRIAPRGKGQGRVCILNYHRVLAADDPYLESEPTVEDFRWQMALLADCFNVLPLDEAIERLARGDLPPRAVCISFDDGYRSVHDLALPVLQEHRLPATVFVTSGYVDGDTMWNDRIIEAVQRLPSGTLDLRDLAMGVHRLGDLSERMNTASDLVNGSKYLPPQARDALAQRLEELIGERLDHGLMLTREMVVNLSRQGIGIGAHTVTHPILTSLGDDDARREIALGKQQLESIVGRPVTLFAYPNGTRGKDFDERHVRMAQEAGYRAAFTTSIGAATALDDPFQLPRRRPWDTVPWRFGLRILQWLSGRY